MPDNDIGGPATSMVGHINEIGGAMVDQLIDGIREDCEAAPNPLLAPERQFFRELASELMTLPPNELIMFCAAAITRIAYPHLHTPQAHRQSSTTEPAS